MNKEEIVLMTTYKNARLLLNSVVCETVMVSDDRKLAIIKEWTDDIVTKLGSLERHLEKDNDNDK
jgi:hypothetical protein